MELSISDCRSEVCIERICRGFVHLIGDVGVEVGGYSDRRVTEAFGHDLQVHTCRQHQRRVAVAEAVEREADAGLLHRRREAS